MTEAKYFTVSFCLDAEYLVDIEDTGSEWKVYLYRKARPRLLVFTMPADTASMDPMRKNTAVAAFASMVRDMLTYDPSYAQRYRDRFG